jgi:hypothetical protein
MMDSVVSCGGLCWVAQGALISTMRRTGRLLTPSTPVSSSALAARPPQPSCGKCRMGERAQLNLSKGMAEYAFDDGGSFINHPGHLLAFRHRSDSGT